MRIPGRRKTPAPGTEPVQPSVGDLAAAAAIIDTYDSMRTDRDPLTVREPLTRVDRYFAYLDWVTEKPDPSIFSAPSTKPGLPNLAAMEYPEFPEPGLTSVLTAFFGLE